VDAQAGSRGSRYTPVAILNGISSASSGLLGANMLNVMAHSITVNGQASGMSVTGGAVLAASDSLSGSHE